jgi:hypothetical protein
MVASFTTWLLYSKQNGHQYLLINTLDKGGGIGKIAIK